MESKCFNHFFFLQEKLSETEAEARRKREELKLKGEAEEEDRKRAEAEDRESGGGGGNIFSAIGSVKDAIKEKLTMPSDVGKERSSAEEHGGAEVEEEEEKKKAVDVEGTPVGATASTLKAVDQMSGQTFNDVGRVDDEGRGVAVVRLHKDKK